MSKTGACFYSLYGLTIKVWWQGKRIQNEIESLFESLPLAKSIRASTPANISLKFTASDIPCNDICSGLKTQFCYGLSICEKDGYVFTTDDQSIFQVKPHTGIGRIFLHYSFKKQSLITKNNFFLIGLIHLFSFHGFYDLHGAGLTRDDVGFLILGEASSGKSSIALSLVHHGWSYVSDDALLLRPSADGVEALAFRKKFYLDPILLHHYPQIAPYLEEPTNGETTKRFLDLELVYPDRFCPSSHPKILIHTSLVPQSESRLVPMDQTAALIKLMKQSVSLFFNRQAVKAHLETLKQLVYQTDSYQLQAGRDLYEEPEKIIKILSDIGI